MNATSQELIDRPFIGAGHNDAKTVPRTGSGRVMSVVRAADAYACAAWAIGSLGT